MTGWIVAGVFRDRELAEQAINALARSGLPRERISVVARDEVYEQAIPGGTGLHGEQMPTEQAAHVAGLDQATDRAMGSLLAVGPLGALLAEIDQSTGRPLVEALGALGMPRADALRCAAEVRRGAVLVAAQAGPPHAEEIRHLLRQSGAEAVLDGARPA